MYISGMTWYLYIFEKVINPSFLTDLNFAMTDPNAITATLTNTDHSN